MSTEITTGFSTNACNDRRCKVPGLGSGWSIDLGPDQLQQLKMNLLFLQKIKYGKIQGKPTEEAIRCLRASIDLVCKYIDQAG